MCQACGLDTRAVERRLREEATTHLRGWYYAAHTQLGKMLMKQGFDVRRSLWDADHVVPLTDGGQFSRPWVWTLCQPCHKRKTAREAALRAAYRGRGSYLGGEGISYEDPSEAKAYWQRYLTGKKEQG